VVNHFLTGWAFADKASAEAKLRSFGILSKNNNDIQSGFAAAN